MARRKSTGGVVEKQTSQGTVFALRFRALGKRHYVTLGYASEGWTRARAEDELANVLADVRRGIWQPPKPTAATEPAPTKPDPTFHEFASRWFAARKIELRPKTIAAYEYELVHLLLPFFAKFRLSQIDVELVDRYRTYMVELSKEREPVYLAWRAACERADKGKKPPRPPRPLKHETINKSLARLAQILETAVEYGHIERNPAKGKRRRLKADAPTRSYLDRADQIEALLAAAAAIDQAEPHTRHLSRYGLFAALVFSGLRIGELLDLRWRSVDLAGGRIWVNDSKTDAGVRDVDLLPVLRDILSARKATLSPEPDAYVFASRSGADLNQTTVRRMLARVAAKADADLAARGLAPLPALTPHSLRRTFASLLFALGRSVPDVMSQMGHSSPTMTLGVYAKVMRRDAGENLRLRKLAGEEDWTPLGTGVGSSARIDPDRPESAQIEQPRGFPLSEA